MEHPHVRVRGMRLDEDGGAPPMIANPMLFDGIRPMAPLPPPVLDGNRLDGRWSCAR